MRIIHTFFVGWDLFGIKLLIFFPLSLTYWAGNSNKIVCDTFRTQRIFTVNAYAHSGPVQTVTSTCLWPHWSACSTRPPAGQRENCSNSRKVRKFASRLSVRCLFDYSNMLSSWFNLWWPVVFKEQPCVFGFQRQKAAEEAPPLPPQRPALTEFITVTSAIKTWPSPPPRSSNTKGNTCILSSDRANLQDEKYRSSFVLCWGTT